MDTDVRKALRGAGSVGAAAMEAILGQQLRHPNVVATLKWAARRVRHREGGGVPGMIT